MCRTSFADAIRALGDDPLRLGSGAGHDGQAMARLCPIGMLFVRCRGGDQPQPDGICATRATSAARWRR